MTSMERKKKANNSSKYRHKSYGGQRNRVMVNKINQLKKEIQAERKLSIQEKIERAKKEVEAQVTELNIKVASRKDNSFIYYGSSGTKLHQKMANSLRSFGSLPESNGNGGSVHVANIISSPTPICLPYVQMIEPCRTWMFKNNKNRKMVAERSIGRRWIRMVETMRIEEEAKARQVKKHKFFEFEDRVLRMVVQDCQFTEDVLNIVTQFVGGTIAEIQERCNYHKERNQAAHQLNSQKPEECEGAIPFERRLDEVSKSFDNHFCLTCYMFGCRLHKVGLDDVGYTAEEQPFYKPEPESDGNKPCSRSCYLALGVPKHTEERNSVDPIHSEGLRKRKPSHLDVSNGAEASSSKKRRASAGDKALPMEKRGHIVEYEEEGITNVSGLRGGSEWRPFEKDLLLKGIEIFGRNSCLITRNTLPGMKTCVEVFDYMNNAEGTSRSGGSNPSPAGSYPDGCDEQINNNSNDGQGSRDIVNMMNQLKSEISVGRKLSIQERIKQNRKVNEAIVSGLITKVASGKDATDDESSGEMLDRRMENPSLFSSCLPGSGYRNTLISKDPPTSAIKIPDVEMLPPYTSWISIRKNKKMVEDQTIVGRRSIYYDPKVQVVKDKFREEDDRILRMAIQKFELSEEVLQHLTQLVGGTTEEIQERCNYLKEKDDKAQKQDSEVLEECGSMLGLLSLDKSLDEATRAFEYIFCRRCKVFDCCVHGVGQDIVYPVEKQPYSHEPESDDSKKPCSKNCYLQLEVLKHPEECHSVDPIHGEGSSKSKTFHSDGVHASYSRKRKSIAGDCTKPVEKRVEYEGEGITNYISGLKQQQSNAIGRSLSRGSEWRPLEKDLLLKGIEIFGRNSCFITRNLLPGMKTCMEVFNYMNVEGMSGGSNANEVPCTEDQEENVEERTGYINLDSTVQVKKSSFCKEDKSREHKQLSKQASDPRIEDGKNKTKQYVPCRCQGACRHNCPCRLNGTCCEKYCGCSKTCKNRFKGCRCTKSLCKSRHCPCYASNRECDPDLCKNCSMSCGDVSQGEPSEKVETLCDNMKLMLGQRKGILLGRSDVSGWGAFVKTPVGKNEYLGEYVGEVITQNEADRRGNAYDLIDRSYLFNLNNQYVIDAYHFGNKLKFANHSSTPNCSAKIMLVNGDHRIGIFTNRSMEAGEEILYDYGYGPEFGREWAKRPEHKKRDAQLARKSGEGGTSNAPCTMKRGTKRNP